MKSWVVDPATSRRFRLVAPIAGGGFTPPPGGAGLLVGETDGFSADFLYPDDTKRVAVKTAGSVVSYAPDRFIANAGTSPKMVYDVAGTLGWSPHNMCLQSQTFDHASWDKATVAVVTPDAIAAPDGTMTADKLAEVASTNNHFARVGAGVVVLNGPVYTLSAYMKQAERSWCVISHDGSINTYFNLATGVVGTVGAGHTTTIVDAGNGWYRCSVTFTSASTAVTPYFHIKVSDAQATYLGVAGSGIYIWGAQLNRGSVPTAYLPTTTAARFGLALDYDPVNHSPKGLLVEPAATNLVPQSAAGQPGFLWTGNGSTKTTSAEIPPNGQVEALQVVITPGTGPGAGLNIFRQAATAIGTTYTASMWCKGTAGQQQWFCTDNNSSRTMQTLVTFTGAWQRVSKTITATVTTSYIGFECYDRTGGANHLPAITFHVWGGQYEAGTAPTSYIPTYAASATRAGDLYNVTPASINYSATAGSWWIETQPGTPVNRVIGYTANSSAPITMMSSTALQMYDPLGVSNTKVGFPNLLVGIHRFAAAFQNADNAITGDGLTVATGVGVANSLLAPVLIYLGSAAAGSHINGYIRQIYYLPRRMTSTELQTKTLLAPASDMLLGETDGFATDFLDAPAAKKVAVKASRVVTEYGVDAFYQNAGTSPKMVYNVAGTLGWSPHNMCIQSQDFTIAGWVKETTTITVAATTAPDGTLTGSKLGSSNAAFGFHDILHNHANIPTIVGETYTWSIYAKAAEMSWIGIASENLNLATDKSFFNLATGALGTKAAAHSGYAISNVGGGWYRCSITFIATGTVNHHPKNHLGLADNQGGITPAAIGDGIYIWGAVFNRGSVPTAYLPTTTAACIGLALDYDPVTYAAKGLLCEPTATNNFPNSVLVTYWGYVASAITVNSATSPLGTATATKLTEDNTVSGHYVYPSPVTATTGVASVFAKAVGRTRFFIQDQQANKGDGFDLSNGTTFSAIFTTTGGATIQNVGNGWYRCSIPVVACTGPLFYLNDGGGTLSYTGDGTSGIYFWGAQIETGTVATSPIPTFAATATRAGDQYKLTPAAINHSATAGSWWVNTETRASVGIFIGQVSFNFPSLYIQNATQIGLFDGNILSKSGLSTVGLHKFMSAYQASDRALTGDGLAPVTDTNSPANLLATTGISIGFGGGGGTNINGYFRKLRYVPRRKTNAEMQTDTL